MVFCRDDLHNARRIPSSPTPPGFSVLACIVASKGHITTLDVSIPLLLQANVSVALFAYDVHRATNRRWWSTLSWRDRLARVGNVASNNNKFDVCMNHADVTNYTHTWFLDADIEFRSLESITDVLSAAQNWKSIFTQPSIANIDHRVLSWNNQCRVRRTDFVEVQMPLIHHRALSLVRQLIGHGPPPVLWGADMIWCRLATVLFDVSDSCIVVSVRDVHHATPEHARKPYNVHVGQNRVSCMRERFERFWATEETLKCLESHRLPRVYIYDLSSLPIDACAVTGSNNFVWETQVEQVLRRIFPITERADRADLFFLPACLTLLWSSHWSSTSVVSCDRCQTYESSVIQLMQTVGNFWTTRRHDHILMRAMCPRVSDALPFPMIFRRLWKDMFVRYLCIETQRFPSSRLDLARTLQVPYFVAPRPVAHDTVKRSSTMTFIGSLCCGRDVALRTISNTLRIFELPRSQHLNTSAGRNTEDDTFMYLNETKFSLQLPGDTPERLNIYQSIVAGVIPVLTESTHPPFNLPNWNHVASTIDMRVYEEMMQILLTHYDDLYSSFLRHRNVFIWHTTEFDNAFRDMIGTTFTNRAQRTLRERDTLLPWMSSRRRRTMFIG